MYVYLRYYYSLLIPNDSTKNSLESIEILFLIFFETILNVSLELQNPLEQ